MITLRDSIKAWNGTNFSQRFKHEVEQLPATELPLQQALQHTSSISGEPITVMVLATVEEASIIHVKAGVIYSGIIGGCSCIDDPTPMSTITEYCELQFGIDKQSGDTTVTLLPS